MKLITGVVLTALTLTTWAQDVVLPPPGIYVPTPTFFVGKNASNYNSWAPPVDIETQTTYAVYLAKSGVAGLIIFGSTGEASKVTNEERTQVITSTRQALDAEGLMDYPIIAGTVTQIFNETIEQLYAAKEAGAQWGVCLVPGYFAATTAQQGLIDWFYAIADQAPMPILIYDYPIVSNNIRVLPSTYVELAKHPNIIGTKLAHMDLSWHVQIASNPAIDYGGFRPYTGLGQQLLPAVAVGAVGSVDVVAAFFPKSVSHLYNLVSKDQSTPEETEEALQLQFKVSAVGEYVNGYGLLSIKEAISRLRGFGERDGVRLPQIGGVPNGDAVWASYESSFAALAEVEDSL